MLSDPDWETAHRSCIPLNGDTPNSDSNLRPVLRGKQKPRPMAVVAYYQIPMLACPAAVWMTSFLFPLLESVPVVASTLSVIISGAIITNT